MTLKYERHQIYNYLIVYKRHGQIHRLIGPASLNDNPVMHWYQYGQLHRYNGPAVYRSDNSVGYWIRGKEVCH